MDKPVRIYIIIILLLLPLNVLFIYEHKPTISDIKTFGRHILEDIGIRDKLPESTTPTVYHAYFKEIKFLNKTNKMNGIEIPERLIIKPGKYNIYGDTYILTDEGLYRFIYPKKEVQQRIVYDNDLDALLSGLSWIHSHGTYDNCVSPEALTSKATNSKLSMTCMYISKWAHYILNNHGIKSRFIGAMTLDNWTEGSVGHNLIEIYREDYKKWVLYDLDNNVYFLHNKTPLSMVEFSDYYKSEDYELKYISGDVNCDILNHKSISPDNGFIFSCDIANNEKTLKKIYKRLMQVTFINDGNYSYYFNDANCSRVESYENNAEYITKDEFIEKFYEN